MKALVLYDSKTGFTEAYARWLAQELAGDCIPAKAWRTVSFSHYDAVLFGSRVRAGMLAAEGLLKRILPAVEGKRTAVFAVGVLPPGAPGTEAVRSRIAAYGPRVFYLQGGVDYEKLGFCGRVLLKGMRGALSKKQERTPEEEAMVQALTNPPSRIDPQAAAPILDYIRGEG